MEWQIQQLRFKAIKQKNHLERRTDATHASDENNFQNSNSMFLIEDIEIETEQVSPEDENLNEDKYLSETNDTSEIDILLDEMMLTEEEQVQQYDQPSNDTVNQTEDTIEADEKDADEIEVEVEVEEELDVEFDSLDVEIDIDDLEIFKQQRT